MHKRQEYDVVLFTLVLTCCSHSDLFNSALVWQIVGVSKTSGLASIKCMYGDLRHWIAMFHQIFQLGRVDIAPHSDLNGLMLYSPPTL